MRAQQADDEGIAGDRVPVAQVSRKPAELQGLRNQAAGQQQDDEERIAPVQHPQRRVEDRRATQAG